MMLIAVSYHSYQTADPAVWQGSYQLHRTSAGISDYHVHLEILEDISIAVLAGMAVHQRQNLRLKSQTPRNITQKCISALKEKDSCHKMYLTYI